ncbi:MAG: hypothetical protein EBZ49_11045 [Proteobacteria bacterium]|nr:hypothetical protein [Pseudomonadota bacterium]
MAGIAKKLDSKGRLVLGPEYANATVLVEEVGEGEFRVQTAAVVPVREAWLFKNTEALNLVQKGLEEAKVGKLAKGALQKSSSWIDKLED